MVMISRDIVRERHGRLVRKVFSNGTATFDWWWAEFVPDLTAYIDSTDEVPEDINPSDDMPAALAAVLARAVWSREGRRLLLHDEGIWVDVPDWETGTEGLRAFGEVLRVFERKGYGIGCTPSRYLLYRR